MIDIHYLRRVVLAGGIALAFVIAAQAQGVQRAGALSVRQTSQSAHGRHDQWRPISNADVRGGNVSLQKRSGTASQVLVDEVYQIWTGGAFQNYYRYTTTYSPDGKMTGALYWEWYSGWDSISVGSYTYNPAGLLTDELWQDFTISGLINYDYTMYAYDGNGFLVQETYQIWNGSAWENNWRYNYTNDMSGNLVEEIEQSWNGAWMDAWRTTSTYNGSGKVVAETTFVYTGADWVATDYGVYTYDGNGFLIEELWYASTGGGWDPSDRYTYTNNSAGHPTEIVWESWTGAAWTNSGRALWTWQDLTLAEKTEGPVQGFWLSSNYPNPFNPTTTIEFSLPKESNVRLIVYDMLGHEIDRLVDGQLPSGRYKAVWDAQAYPSGTYAYKLEAGDFVAVKKLVLIK